MLFANKTDAERAIKATVKAATGEAGTINFGDARRLPVKTADSGKIRLGGACRFPVKTA